MMTRVGRYRWRTELRPYLPWALLEFGVAAKGSQDCGANDWYRYHAATARCCHCTVGTQPYLTNAAI
jgi:hypothetical protein